MGTKLTKEKNYIYSSSNIQNYENRVRSYAKWNHQAALVSHDETRFSSNEIKNLNKNNKSIENSNNSSEYLTNRILSNNNNISKKNIIDKKSESMKELNNIITVEQLIKSQKEKEIKLNSSLLKNSHHQSLLTINNQIPFNLQLILINQNDLQNINEIGKGNFGIVYRALYKNKEDVALKTFKSDKINEYDNKSLYELLHEAYIMTCLKHRNVLSIIGITFIGYNKQLSLVTEFMINGSLLNYLRKHQQIFIKSNSKEITFKLNHFSKQIFQAMLYLEDKSIIHRDLAARNCLIGNDHLLKVADFGLTKLTDCGLYKGTYHTICAPRWSSPEAIFHSKYSSRSDVWSYGITLWEIYSLGERPYGNIDNNQLKIILNNSSENLSHYLPQSNQFGSDEIYTHLILPCLTYNVNLRPKFIDLNERIINILN